MAALQALEELVPRFVVECKQRDVVIELDFSYQFLHLLAHDDRYGLTEMKKRNNCRKEQFLQVALDKFFNPLDATMCNFKLSYFFKNCKEVRHDAAKKLHEEMYKNKLRQLLDHILQYPETSNKEQLDKMFMQMQIFILSSYSLGCPKHQMLLKKTAQALNSVMGSSDLLTYVRKKYFHRLEYLERLSATVSGILIYNHQSERHKDQLKEPKDKYREQFRNIYADLEMAIRNTREALEAGLQQILELKAHGAQKLEQLVEINIEVKKAYLKLPTMKVRQINDFVILFNVYERCMRVLIASFEKTVYLQECSEKKMNCVIEKITEVLTYRTAVESEQIFPHFVYLSEVWKDLVSYLNHYAEINRIKDRMDFYVSDDLRNNFFSTIERIEEECLKVKEPFELTFDELMYRTTKVKSKPNLACMDKECIKEYCCLTLAYTYGLLVPSTIQKNLCRNTDLIFGFKNMDFTKYASRYYDEFLASIENVLFTSIDLMTLCNLEQEILKQDFVNLEQLYKRPKHADFGTQTEMVVVNDLSVPNRINVTWNSWDFYREAIRMANIRKTQTHSTQTFVSYGQRIAQNQAYRKKDA